jgi:hypothetical protein
MPWPRTLASGRRCGAQVRRRRVPTGPNRTSAASRAEARDCGLEDAHEAPRRRPRRLADASQHSSTGSFSAESRHHTMAAFASLHSLIESHHPAIGDYCPPWSPAVPKHWWRCEHQQYRGSMAQEPSVSADCTTVGQFCFPLQGLFPACLPACALSGRVCLHGAARHTSCDSLS